MPKAVDLSRGLYDRGDYLADFIVWILIAPCFVVFFFSGTFSFLIYILFGA